MSHEYPEDDRLAAHRAKLIASGVVQMTVDEILAGNTQAGVPRPSFLKDHDDDGTVQRVDGPEGGERDGAD